MSRRVDETFGHVFEYQAVEIAVALYGLDYLFLFQNGTRFVRIEKWNRSFFPAAFDRRVVFYDMARIAGYDTDCEEPFSEDRITGVARDLKFIEEVYDANLDGSFSLPTHDLLLIFINLNLYIFVASIRNAAI